MPSETHPKMFAEVVSLAAPALPLDTAALFRTHAGEVSRWVRALAGPHADCDDLVQEVFIVAHRQRSAFRHESAVSSWLFGIAAHLVRRHRRVQKFRSWLKGSANDVAGQLSSTAVLAPDALEKAQARAQVYRVLDTLKDNYRTALILFELEGRSAAEIGALCGVTPSVVWVWLSRARAEFSKRLKQLEASEGPTR
ncbi:MAG: RNA polymerase sigma factor [Myxococcaceae bacterium]|nr:RNA polymerase sigma factor [Myxococcaceae bacterium]